MEFDLFLSFSSADRAAARELCTQLRAHGICVWFDEEQLLPGRSVQRRMKRGLASSTAGAVLLGADGLGPWQDEEMQVLLSQAVRHGKAVIPVLLPKAPAEPQDPFLASRRWVDLRSGLGGAAFEQLLRGIRAALSEQGGDLSPNDGASQAGVGAADAPPPPVVRVFLASPDDVQDERERALEAIEALTLEPGLRGLVRVDPVVWDKPRGGAPMNPREAIAAGLPKPSECDVLVVVFGARMGTPLDPDWQTKPDGSPYRSCTEWKFLDGLRAAEVKGGAPEILVYRRAKAPGLALDESDFDEILGQWREVEAFFAEYFHSDAKAQRDYSTYDSPSDLQERLTADLIKLASKRVVEPSAEVLAEAPRWSGSPYPGLRALRDGDAPVFFGRRRDADALIERLKDPGCRFLAVVGPSGSGKSSLVWAGVLPRLKDNAVSGSGSWSWLRFTPAQLADDSFLSLAAQLAEHFPSCGWEPRDLVPGLCKGEELGVILDKAFTQVPDGAELLLFADQLEELFRRVAERDRGAFVDLLARASVHPRVRILATLRADFIPDCLKYPPLAELLNAGQRLLAAPGQSARERMVTEPARRAGLDLEPELAWRIVSNTGDEPGALPLMAYALERLYECDGETGCLTHASYDAFGGVRGAIADQAQQVFAGFAGERTEVVADAALKVLFVELVDVEDERAPATRRRAPLSRLAALPEVADLVRRLTDARLLVTDRPAGKGSEPVVDVAHEALLHGWDRLADWIARRRDDLRLRDRLRRDAEEWERDGFRTKHLPGRERAEDMRQALDSRDMAGTPTEAAFFGPGGADRLAAGARPGRLGSGRARPHGTLGARPLQGLRRPRAGQAGAAGPGARGFSPGFPRCRSADLR